MAERTIRQLGDPVLRRVCKPISEITPNVNKLLDDLVDTLYAAPDRAGLAAPQVGIPKRIAVLDVGDGLIELINPVIVKQKGSQTGAEACLSIPGAAGIVKRAEYVAVKTLNRAGEEIMIEGKGSLAVCLQHEIDHLDGILYIDHVKPGDLFHQQTRQPIDVLKMIQISRSGRNP
ncbi:peptide deformylase [Brevibacillus sp. B_LB10_24]|uniref:peptide deformylase n=1 Tax=Brevibacillus TaxID=55080 RepID=UPI0003106160|nr:peptide deformylase [Brevibacillus massiliensis]